MDVDNQSIDTAWQRLQEVLGEGLHKAEGEEAEDEWLLNLQTAKQELQTAIESPATARADEAGRQRQFWSSEARTWQDRAEAAEARVRDLQHPLLRDSYACERCGRIDGMDAVLDNELWEQVSEGDQYKILCLWCIDHIAHEQGLSGVARLYFSGAAIRSAMPMDDQDTLMQSLREAEARVRALQTGEES